MRTNDRVQMITIGYRIFNIFQVWKTELRTILVNFYPLHIMELDENVNCSHVRVSVNSYMSHFVN